MAEQHGAPPRRSPPPLLEGADPKRRRADASPTHALDADAGPAPQDLTALTALPSDMLAYLFAFVPLRPRLLVLSAVCKRWRYIVFTSLSALPPLRWAKANLAPALGLFSRLTSLSLTALARIDHPLPGRLRHLCMRRVAALSLTALVELTGLTSLELADCAIGRREFMALLDPLRTSLTSLSLNVFAAGNAAYLHATHFPRLADLELSFAPVKQPGSTNDIVIAHAEQLTRLSVQTIRSVADYASLPRLTSFTVTYYDVSRLAQFMLRHPRVTELRLLGGFTLPAIDAANEAHFAPALRTIALSSPQVEVDLRVLAPLTRLSSLCMPHQLLLFHVAPAALCAQLTALDIHNAFHASPPAVLSLFSNVTSLGFRSQALTDATAPVSLSRLRSLTYREDSPINLANFLRVFMDGCPALSTLCFNAFQYDGVLTEFAASIHQRGVEELILVGAHDVDAAAVQAAKAANRWLWVRTLTLREVSLIKGW